MVEMAMAEKAEAAVAETVANPRRPTVPTTTVRGRMYAARIQRAIEKQTAELKALQEARKAAFAKAQEEAVLLTQLVAAGEDFDPAQSFDPPEAHGGFVYSQEQIHRLVTHLNRLQEARTLLENPKGA